MSLIKAYCSANFPVCAHSTQTGKFVLQEPQDGPAEKRPIIELMSFIIKLALLYLLSIGMGMTKNILLVLIYIIVLITLGCDNVYYDEHLKMEVQQLDSDLENRWSTTGVVVSSIDPNGPAEKANLSEGELISYVIGEYSIQNPSEFKQAVKKAMTARQ